MSRWLRKQVERCVANPLAAYFTEQRGIAFCSRCGFARGLHDSIRAQRAKARDGKTGGDAA